MYHFEQNEKRQNGFFSLAESFGVKTRTKKIGSLILKITNVKLIFFDKVFDI